MVMKLPKRELKMLKQLTTREEAQPQGLETH